MVANYRAVVESNEKINAKIYKTVFRLIEPVLMEFKAGQFINILVAPNTRRSYSIGSSPAQNTKLDIYTDVTPGGPGSKFFEAAKAGDEASFIGPLGLFVYEDNENSKAIFIATGTGLAPFYSMICYALETLKSKREIKLYLGFRYEEDCFLLDELEMLEEKYSNFSFCLTLSKPSDSWRGNSGYVTKYLEQDLKEDLGEDLKSGLKQNLKDELDQDLRQNLKKELNQQIKQDSKKKELLDAYICGGQAMITSVNEFLINKGISPDNIYSEKFF
ncbi:hypothetical protein JW796_02350 [Candidatus Dojkabacteria bacterium]|nr:hypothetical protein [Candidatus Dojkabacteria bacterium]